ncbi:MAG: hypothetical protein H0V39_04670 [Nitrosomonas sp.]|nr:hypothetical protein [Nitrosomonas sp.]
MMATGSKDVLTRVDSIEIAEGSTAAPAYYPPVQWWTELGAAVVILARTIPGWARYKLSVLSIRSATRSKD